MPGLWKWMRKRTHADQLPALQEDHPFSWSPSQMLALYNLLNNWVLTFFSTCNTAAPPASTLQCGKKRPASDTVGAPPRGCKYTRSSSSFSAELSLNVSTSMIAITSEHVIDSNLQDMIIVMQPRPQNGSGGRSPRIYHIWRVLAEWFHFHEHHSHRDKLLTSTSSEPVFW